MKNHKSIDIKEFIKDVAGGATNDDLLRKYALTVAQLKGLFRRLERIRRRRVLEVGKDLAALMKKHRLTEEGLRMALEYCSKLNFFLVRGDADGLGSPANRQVEVRGRRARPRVRPKQVIAATEAGRPYRRFVVRDLSETGISLLDMPAEINQIYSLQVIGDELGLIPPFEFDGLCRWVDTNGDANSVCAGFLIVRISDEALTRLHGLIRTSSEEDA